MAEADGHMYIFGVDINIFFPVYLYLVRYNPPGILSYTSQTGTHSGILHVENSNHPVK